MILLVKACVRTITEKDDLMSIIALEEDIN